MPRTFVATVCLLAALAGPARAEPDAHRPGDAVLHLLQERGLWPGQRARHGSQPDGAADARRGVRDGADGDELPGRALPARRQFNAEQGFDCSGFTRYVFEHSLGLVLPRRADEQAQQAGLAQVLRDELKPGDLVFFNTMRRAFSHVGIYVGDGKFIHAPRSGGEVRIEDMRQAYWSKRFNGARRAEVAAAGHVGPRR
jgi:cell wall-associated NlpC family hydrolase